MFQHSYPVLLVDDDPDVLSVSKLALRSMTVFGVPLNVSAASSKKEAIDMLGRRTIVRGRGVAPFTVALIDVVMETDTAGLELCQYIRDTMKDKITQIYIRTGQAGLAPERSVIDRYDINGYFTKVELTEQKLYTLVKAGVREVHNTSRHYLVGRFIDALIANAGSTERMSSVFSQTFHALRDGPDGRPTNDIDPRVAVVIDGKVVANVMDQGDEAVLGRSRDLAALPGTPVGPITGPLADAAGPSEGPGPDGDRYVVDKGCFQLTVAKSPSTVEARFLAMTPGEPAEFMAEPYHRMLHAAAMLWKQAQAS